MKKDIPLKERIIFPLDVDSESKAKDWVKRLESHIGFFKVGLQLFLSSWFHIVDWIIDRGHKVMLDLKLYDIPQTVESAIKEISKRPIAFTTVHGDREILKAAAGKKENVKVLAVTVLTSLSPNDLKELGYSMDLKELVIKRAQDALNSGCDGVVCSGLEVEEVRKKTKEDFIIVVPGVRPYGEKKDDQKRVVDVRTAFEKGADFVVVGRPIKNSKDPIKTVEDMQKEILDVLKIK